MASVLAFARHLPAQSKNEPVHADVLFEEGRKALASKDYVLACGKFSASYRLDRAAGTLMNWATCEEQLNELVSAWQHWKDAVANLPPNDSRLGYAETQLRRVGARLPYLKLSIAAGAPADTRVERDGMALDADSVGIELPVDPGAHRIVARAARRQPRELTIVVQEREHRSLAIAPGVPLPNVPASNASASKHAGSSGTSTKFKVGLIAGGFGLAGVATATISGLMLPSRQKTVDENCADGVCNPKGLAAASEGKRLIVVNTTGWVVGGVGLGIGTYLLVSDAGRHGQETPRPAERLAIMPRDGGLTMSYARAF